jgi:syringate O-demethylase
MKPYREWLTESAYETTAPLGGSFYSNSIEDYAPPVRESSNH